MYIHMHPYLALIIYTFRQIKVNKAIPISLSGGGP